MVFSCDLPPAPIFSGSFSRSHQKMVDKRQWVGNSGEGSSRRGGNEGGIIARGRGNTPRVRRQGHDNPTPRVLVEIPLHDRFISEAARMLYLDTFADKNGVIERPLNLDKVSDVFRQQIEKRGWAALTVVPITPPNMSLVREFFANMCTSLEMSQTMMVRGRLVTYSAASIRDIYGLPEVHPETEYDAWLADKLADMEGDLDEEARMCVCEDMPFKRGRRNHQDLYTGHENFDQEYYSM